MDKMAFTDDQSLSIPSYINVVDQLIKKEADVKKKTMYWIDRLNWMIVSITGEEPTPYYNLIKRWLKEKDQHGIMSISFLYRVLDPIYQRSLLNEHKPLKYVIAAVIKQHNTELLKKNPQSDFISKLY